jgi:hypothetical protein
VKKPEVKFGAEPKKLIVLGALVVIAVIAYFISSSDTPKNTATPEPGSAVNTARIDPAVPAAGPNAPRAAGGRGPKGAPPRNFAQRTSGTEQEFRPTLKPKDPIDPARVDPTLRLALLAKLKGVGLEGGGRTLFDFSGAPGPDAAKADIARVKPIIPGGVKTAKIIGPTKPEEPKPGAAASKPPPTPIPLKFYGFQARQSGKRAFFLEGEDIFVAGEGDLIKNRYKVIRIGVNSAVVEDTSNKHQQTLPLEAEQANT